MANYQFDLPVTTFLDAECNNRIVRHLGIPGIGAFSFPDHSVFPPYEVDHIVIGEGDGETTEFNIKCPLIQNGTPRIYVNNVELTAGTDFVVDCESNCGDWYENYHTLILSVVLFVVIPLAGGIMTRSVITKKRGVDYFQNGFIPKFGNVTTIGLLLTLVIIFSFQGNVILENPLHIVLIAVPLIIQTFLIFFIAYLASKALKLPHDIAAPAGMIGASNFFELAVAVAISLFGTQSPVALATIVGVLVEVPVMLTLVKIANRTKGWFPA